MRPIRREGSMIALSPAAEVLFVADEDRGAVHVVPLPVNAKLPVKTVQMPGQPAQVLALEDRVLVTIRSEGAIAPGLNGSSEPMESAAPKKPGEPARYVKPKMVPSSTGPGLLLVMRPDEEKGLVVEQKVALPGDAWGIAVTPDAKSALVTSAWTHEVSGVELATGKVRFSLSVPREPRAVVVHPDGTRAYVTHLVGTGVTRLDGIDGEGAEARAISLPAAPHRTPLGMKSNASLAYSATLSPDGEKLFVPRHALGATGPQVWMGGSTVDVLLTRDDSSLAPPAIDGPRLATPDMNGQWVVHDEMTGGEGMRVAPNPFVQPRAVVYRKSTETLLVASEGSDTVVELLARPIDPSMFVKKTHSLPHDADDKFGVANVCGAPSGIALSSDEKTAWVFCRATGMVVELPLDRERDSIEPRVRLGEDPLPAQAALGRRLYYNGTDEVTSGGMGCAGCHPEGRDDGHVWHEAEGVSVSPNFFAGSMNVPSWNQETGRDRGVARQTPMLAGRVAWEGPYGWHAESPHLADRLSNGFLLHRWGGLPGQHEKRELYDRAMALRAFLRIGLVPPPREARELTDEEKLGKEVFERVDTKCTGCHTPETDHSDRAPYAVWSSAARPGFVEDPEAKYKTPSLLFVGGTAPYGHDGRFSTLEELVDRNDDRMGNTKQLTKAERKALVSYLRTL